MIKYRYVLDYQKFSELLLKYQGARRLAKELGIGSIYYVVENGLVIVPPFVGRRFYEKFPDVVLYVLELHYYNGGITASIQKHPSEVKSDGRQKRNRNNKSDNEK